MPAAVYLLIGLAIGGLLGLLIGWLLGRNRGQPADDRLAVELRQQLIQRDADLDRVAGAID